jgi:two-component sensor histidine kinase
MVLHELVTNAVKYGALSTSGGQVSVSWDRPKSEDMRTLVVIEWRERGGPAIVAPIQSGYGTSLIRDLIPHELGGTVDLVFESKGVCCRVDIPVDGR